MHAHRAKTKKMYSFSRIPAGLSAEENARAQKAAGGVMFVARCSCGAIRETISNGRFQVRSPWQEIALARTTING